MSKGLEALHRIANAKNHFKYDTLELVDKDFQIVQQELQRLESIDNAEPSEALKKLEMLSDCAEAIKEAPSSNWVEYANSENELDLKLWMAYEDLKDYILKAQEQEKLLKTGDLSDGYHTFNQLYYQRCVLFASLVRLNKDKSWKSFKHSDGKYCFDSNGEWFIVGIDTPIGSYTYHYEKKYWDLFECQELECGKEWDGHTEEDVTRLLSLPNEQEKVFEIIKNKTVSVFQIKCCKNALEYNDLKFLDKEKITEEEFDLVKRYCDEQNN